MGKAAAGPGIYSATYSGVSLVFSKLQCLLLQLRELKGVGPTALSSHPGALVWEPLVTNSPYRRAMIGSTHAAAYSISRVGEEDTAVHHG